MVCCFLMLKKSKYSTEGGKGWRVQSNPQQSPYRIFLATTPFWTHRETSRPLYYCITLLLGLTILCVFYIGLGMDACISCPKNSSLQGYPQFCVRLHSNRFTFCLLFNVFRKDFSPVVKSHSTTTTINSITLRTNVPLLIK